MADSPSPSAPPEQPIDLKNPFLAAGLSWLIPGAGQLYQGRTAKGLLFMVCILTTFFYGLLLGGGKVVYASMREARAQTHAGDTVSYSDKRLAYFCQVFVGVPALPALVQAYVTSGNEPGMPLWNGLMAPPMLPNQVVPRERLHGPNDPGGGPRYVRSTVDELHLWNFEYAGRFDLGTIFTMIAGLLNVLVIFDAGAGPMWPARKNPEPGPAPAAPPGAAGAG